MRDSHTICALCGHSYRPESHQGCPSCPIQPDCNIICCPSCGFSDVDPSTSKVATWISTNLLHRKDDLEGPPVQGDGSVLSIADLPPGMEAIVVSIQSVQERRREQLMAYGLAPGRCVKVLQHNPATILKVDHTELAIEDNVAKRILVEMPDHLGRNFPGRHVRRRRRQRHRLKFLRRRRKRGKK